METHSQSKNKLTFNVDKKGENLKMASKRNEIRLKQGDDEQTYSTKIQLSPEAANNPSETECTSPLRNDVSKGTQKHQQTVLVSERNRDVNAKLTDRDSKLYWTSRDNLYHNDYRHSEVQSETETVLSNEFIHRATSFFDNTEELTTGTNLSAQGSDNIQESLGQNKPPTQEQLDHLCKTYGRKSKEVSDACSQIIEFIKSKFTKHKVHVWAAYQYKKEDKIIFVVHVPDKNFSLEGIDYSLKLRLPNDCNEEGKAVLNQKKESKLSKDDIDKINDRINRFSTALMKKHKYLSIISGSYARSRGYGTSSFKITQEACIVLYVRAKNFIPLEEEPFENEYEEVAVDVREGEFILYGKNATEFHEHLPLSCQIGSSADPKTNLKYAGALGCFLEHPEYSLCGLTCAHVLLFSSGMEVLGKDGLLKWPFFQSNGEVFQPLDSEESIGRLVQAVYDTGGEDRPGFEAAIFQIEKRHPTSGKFPKLEENDLQINFDSGKTYGFSRLGKNEAIKIGPVTDLTRGHFRLENHHTAVKTVHQTLQLREFNIMLHKQIEVEPVERDSNGLLKPFAKYGDSGALVFITENDEDLVCIGIVEGGTSHDTTIVTPIKPILNALNVTGIKSFENENIVKTIESMNTKLDLLCKKLL